MEKMLIFTDPPPPPPKGYGLYTRENVDIYGWPLSTILNNYPDCKLGQNVQKSFLDLIQKSTEDMLERVGLEISRMGQ